MTRTNPFQRLGWLIAGLGVVAAGCSANNELGPDAPSCDDGGVCGGGFVADAGAPFDGGDAAEVSVVDPTGGDASAEVGEACFDGQDNDSNRAIDCDQIACQDGYPSCCVGRSGASCCSAPVTVAEPTFGGCTGPLDGTCADAAVVSGMTPFGLPSPRFGSAALFPGGDLSYDSGVVVDAPIGPGRAITLTGTLALPSGECLEGCVESAAVGLTTASGYSDSSYVRALVGLVANASRHRVELVLNGEVAAHTELVAPTTDIAFALTLSPTGEVTATGTFAPLSGRVQRSGDLHVVAWGHNMNSTSDDRARVLALTASTSICDAPATWVERAPLALGDGTLMPPVPAPSVAAPSVADVGGESLLAFEANDLVILARRTAPSTTYALVGGYMTSAINDSSQVFHDPELVALPDGLGVRLYVATASGTIAYADAALGAGIFPPPTLALAPDALGATIDRLDGPSVLAPSDPDTQWHMVVRAIDKDGRSSLVHLVSLDGVTFDFPSDSMLAPSVPGTLESATLRTPQGSFAAFDRDEVAAPDVYRQGGTVNVAYAGRAGARWSIGLLVSDAFAHMRPAAAGALLDDGAVLAGSAVSGDADSLSVSDPDVVVRGGQVELFYTGSDGARTRLARASRAAFEGL